MANKTAKGLTFIFGADMKGFERAMKKSQRNIKKFGNDMKRLGKSLTMNLTLPMAAFAAASLPASYAYARFFLDSAEQEAARMNNNRE